VYIGASNNLEAQAYTPIILSPRLETPLVFDDYQSFERPSSMTDTPLRRHLTETRGRTRASRGIVPRERMPRARGAQIFWWGFDRILQLVQ
jgi:hypothetical protein